MDDEGDGDGNAHWTWTNESYPADAVSLRSVSSDNFVIIDTTREPRVIGETDFSSGPATLHAKAIYLLEGKLYQVERLDFDGRKAFVREVDSDYYTDAITHTRVTIIDTFATARSAATVAADASQDADANSHDGGSGAIAPMASVDPPNSTDEDGASHGEVHVVSRVVGFKKIKFYTNENVGSGELDLPEQQMHTTAYWLTVPRAVMAVLPYAADDRRDGVIGLAFAMGQIAQLMLMCDRHDIGISIDAGEKSASDAPDPLLPRVFIYDNYPGGIGFSEPLFRMHHELLEATRRLISDCPCENGCPGCVGPLGDSGPLAKAAALRILELIHSEPVVAEIAQRSAVETA
jgi:DEAD/DEAH box helicase domain-containing protein